LTIIYLFLFVGNRALKSLIVLFERILMQKLFKRFNFFVDLHWTVIRMYF
jgi:hypothetical protein